MPLTHFLLLLALVILLGAMTIWLAASAGVSIPMLAVLLLAAAGVARLMARVH